MQENNPKDNIDRYRLLAFKWVEGTITHAELAELEDWYNSGLTAPLLLPADFAAKEGELRSAMFQAIKKNLGIHPLMIVHSSRRKWIVRTIAAAVLLIALAAPASFLIWKNHINDHPVPTGNKFVEVMPGHNGAVLHLSNGATIVLDSVQNGIVARQGAVQIVKENGVLRYMGKSSEPVYNTVVTEPGNQWNLVLPDGTKVWLNAKSSLRYPLVLNEDKRSVELTGEAYFEVKHNSQHPFRVVAGGQVMEDIGTAFDVNAYSDEPVVRTTLAEGAIKTRDTLQMKEVILRPGQQAVVKDHQVTVSSGNIDQALAWKNGLFGFDHADIHEVMRQVERWYKVEIVFEGKPAQENFQGEIGRSLTLSQLLKGLEQIGVHVRMEEGNRIVILP